MSVASDGNWEAIRYYLPVPQLKPRLAQKAKAWLTDPARKGGIDFIYTTREACPGTKPTKAFFMAKEEEVIFG